jgi:hypothetical protein
MIQKLNGLWVYVVEFDTLPELPVLGFGVEKDYAEALTAAIRTGVITEGGKYAIHLSQNNTHYDVYKILE